MNQLFRIITMKFCIHITFFLFSLAVSTFGRSQSDSAAISNYFSGIQLEQKTDSLIQKIESFKQSIAKTDLDQFYYHFAKYLLVHGDIENAKMNAKNGINILRQDSTTYKSIKLFNLIAAAHSLQKDYVKAIEYFNRSIKISDKINNKKQSAYLQNNVANIFFSIQDYTSAYDYALKAYNNIKIEKDDPYRLQILSVLSVAEAKIGKTKSARAHALKAMKEASEIKDSISLIVAYYSLGDIALSMNNWQLAKKEFSKSLELSEKLNNHNYIMLTSIGLLNVSISLAEYEAAIKHGENGLQIAMALQNDNTIYSIKKNLATAYFETGKSEMAYKLLKDAHLIYTESTNSERQKAINDILIKYDTEKKEKELATQNVQLLEKDIKTSRFFQIILTLCFLILLGIIYFIFQRHRTKQKLIQQTIENEKNTLLALISGEEEERTRLATELHDGLASSLTAARYKLENNNVHSIEDKEALIALLKRTHEDTRRIAHNLSPLMLETFGLYKSIEHFASENQNQSSKIQVFLNGDDTIINKSTALIMYRFSQELIQNALKYANSSLISINFITSADSISLMVEDNGIGFDLKKTHLKGGLLSIKSRVESLRGDFEVNSTPNHGTVIHINLPVE